MKTTATSKPGPGKRVLVLLKFRICGNARFLSHAETLRIFQRACVRARIDMAYSAGFNPRPKLSLPLPRSVGVEAEDETLALAVRADQRLDVEHLKGQLAQELPEGFELTHARLAPPHQVLNKGVATYVLSVKEQPANEGLADKIKALVSRRNLVVDRSGDSLSKRRRLDVRGFLKSVELTGHKISIDCAFGPTGTARVDEMTRLLGLTIEDLDSPIRRVRVLWQDTLAANAGSCALDY